MMCEAKVYLKKDEELELLMEDCISIIPEGNKLILRDILGKSEVVEGKILEVELLDHKVILTK
ncbi:MAG TPA: CooT family nickel-binding protein [Actinobacteria bacterium]|nr:CooT family nickel-binding protein [Actinomycetota bacterium]